jgi:radical SAM protein with 4Fe4S-binding SPASM domain
MSDWIHFIDENHRLINSINYGTGENTLVQDWFELVKYIRLHYPVIRQSLTTNGYLSKAIEQPRNLQIFCNSIDEVDISLDFSDSQKHNLFRGQTNAYSWALKALEVCNKYKKQLALVFVGCTDSLKRDNIDGLFAIAKKYSAYVRMNLYRPVGGINKHTKLFIAEYETVIDILRYIADRYKIVSIADQFFSAILTGKKREDPSGKSSLRIFPDGDITPNTYLTSPEFSKANIRMPSVLNMIIKEKRFAEICRHLLPVECNDCIYATICSGGVLDRRYLWNNSLIKRDPYCPGRFSKKIFEEIILYDMNFYSIHDNYLPTMIFAN